jgi:peptide deformylase
MAIREIVTLPHPVLRRKARKVTDFGPELQTLIDDMVETMRAEPGVGLAANQVNVPLRLVVVEYAEDDEKEDSPLKLYAVANPEFTRLSQDMVMGTEGCLSIPGYIGNVERHEAVVVKGQNRRGQPVTIRAKGWLARIFQHELDHLDGVVFTDRAEQVWKSEEQPADAIGD